MKSELRKPEWLKTQFGGLSHNFAATKKQVSDNGLNTVCRSAQCPNLHECWSAGTATFLLLGNSCTRSCRFCAVTTSASPPLPLPDEPERIARAVKSMRLGHVVLTSVTRDDLDDGGSSAWAETVEAVRRENPQTTVECLIPDFRGERTALERVMSRRPDILNHNVETVPYLYETVRPQADYRRSLDVLRMAGIEFGLIAKSGLMVGMGETEDQIMCVLDDLAETGCRHVTIGQYLQPSFRHYPVHSYVTPECFERYRQYAEGLGFRNVQSGPYVRSSYHAAETLYRKINL